MLAWKNKQYQLWLDSGCEINENVTELIIPMCGINALPDLKNLPNLKIINCRGNKLKNLNGIEGLVKLKILNCSNNELSSLNEIKKLTNLKILNCNRNKLKNLNGIKRLVKLKNLDCWHNELKNLNGIEELKKMEALNCRNNKLISLKGIEELTKLRTLDCSGNKLTTLNDIKKLTKLKTLDCSVNNLTTLNGTKGLRNLENLRCSQNRLTELKGIEGLTKLDLLYCHHNKLTNVNELCNLNKITEICFFHNPIDYIPPNILRKLEKIDNGQNIYNDSQNVHNYEIHESIRKSVNNILNIKPLIIDFTDLIVNDPILTNKTKEILIEYSNDKNIYIALNITFNELLIAVFNRIEINEHKDEIKRVLNIEMNDSVCKCFTGRISRLVNCLNGFDELVNIQISQIIKVKRQ